MCLESDHTVLSVVLVGAGEVSGLDARTGVRTGCRESGYPVAFFNYARGSRKQAGARNRNYDSSGGKH